MREQQIKNEQDKVSELLSTRDFKAVQMAKTQEQRDYDHMIHKEIEMMKREERLENVERIGRANQHKQFKIMHKI